MDGIVSSHKLLNITVFMFSVSISNKYLSRYKLSTEAEGLALRCNAVNETANARYGNALL